MHSNRKFIWVSIALLVALVMQCRSQGFVNLNFESANVSGYSQATYIPIAKAFPGWSATMFNASTTNANPPIVYDGISTGGAGISIVDKNAAAAPLNGNFSAFLFGGGTSVPDSVELSQTGLVPAGTLSLLFNAYNVAAPFVVTLGGQIVNMVPLQTFSNYTLYGGNISSMAGAVESLNFIEPPASFVGPSFFELDNIQFSSSPVPEPGALALTAFGSILLGFGFRGRWTNKIGFKNAGMADPLS
jgi:hypothetical protein